MAITNSPIICLQGGRELTPGCEDMDQQVLEAAPGPVAVLAGAARAGSDYEGATARALDWYGRLGADVRSVPDPRERQALALAELTDDLALLVLPGGSPSLLRQALSGAVGQRVRELHAAGMGLTGASAGAMVLCQRVVLPQGGRQVDGLGLAPGVALVHWTGPTRERPPADGLLRWGLPEQGGALIVEGMARAVGQGEPAWLRGGRWTTLPREGGSAL